MDMTQPLTIEAILHAHAEDDDGFCFNSDCAFNNIDIHTGDHISHIADVIRYALASRPRSFLPHITVGIDGSHTQNVPMDENQFTNWTGPRKMDR